MTNYLYTREFIHNNDGQEPVEYWNIDNPRRVDEEGKQIHLAKEISEALPEEKFILLCSYEEVKLVFENELDEASKNTLDECVNNHKNNL